MWNLLAEKKPEPGQLCVIQFSAEGSSLRLCRYDDKSSWMARNPDVADDEVFWDDWPSWFTENDDEEDWWEVVHVRAWWPVEEPQR